MAEKVEELRERKRDRESVKDGDDIWQSQESLRMRNREYDSWGV